MSWWKRSQAERRPEPGRPAKSTAHGIPAVWSRFLLHPANSSFSLSLERLCNQFLRSHCLFLQLHVCDSFPFQAGAPEPEKAWENIAQDRSSPNAPVISRKHSQDSCWQRRGGLGSWHLEGLADGPGRYLLSRAPRGTLWMLNPLWQQCTTAHVLYFV